MQHARAMNSTKTDDREQWRNRILRALAELRPDEKALDRSLSAGEQADMTGGATSAAADL